MPKNSESYETRLVDGIDMLLVTFVLIALLMLRRSPFCFVVTEFDGSLGFGDRD